MKILIKGGRVIDPANCLDGVMDVLIESGKIIKVEPNISCEAHRIIEAQGYWVTPGFIDLHVHFRDPGLTQKETLKTGAMSARAGGFTTVCCMPNTVPVIDGATTVLDIKSRAEADGIVNILPVGAITKGQDGQSPAELEGMFNAGVRALSEDGKSVATTLLLKEAMKFSAERGITILSHCEDMSLVNGGVMNEGVTAQALGLNGISSDSEEVIIARDIVLARSTGARLHICHVSTAFGAQLIREAKARGEAVTGEVCPHHFTLTDDLIDGSDSNYKMNPPLRSRSDVEALMRALADGTIDVIATDHAPHTIQDKSGGFQRAANGIVGLETALALCITELIDGDRLTPYALIEKLTANPAKILGLRKGTLTPGEDADITITDPNLEYKINPEAFLSKSKNTPFGGRLVKGKVIYSIYKGDVMEVR